MTTLYPGYRTMTGAQRYNARMEKIWDKAYELAARKAELAARKAITEAITPE
jgi:hypothetical protein